MNNQDFSIFCKNDRRGVFYQVHRDHIKEFGAENAIFFSVISDYFQKIKRKRKSEKGTVFALSVNEMADLTGLSISKVKQCLEFWTEKEFILSKGDAIFTIKGF